MTDALRIPGKRIIQEEFLVMVGKSRDEWKEEAMCVEGGVEGLEERAELGAEGSTAWRGQKKRERSGLYKMCAAQNLCTLYCRSAPPKSYLHYKGAPPRGYFQLIRSTERPLQALMTKYEK